MQKQRSREFKQNRIELKTIVSADDMRVWVCAKSSVIRVCDKRVVCNLRVNNKHININPINSKY